MGIENLNKSNWCCFDDGEGHLYIGHAQSGMSIINLKNKTVRKLSHTNNNPQSLPGNSIYSIYKDHLQNIWIGTNRGLGLFNPKTEEFTVFRHESDNPHSLIADHSKHGVTSGNIRTLLQDSFGNIWIGNYSSGVDFISHSQPGFHILPYMTEKGNITKHKPVWGICKDENNQIWLGGENEITLFKDNKLLKSIDITKQLSRPYGQVFSIISTQQGALLLGIYDDGLLKFNTRNIQLQQRYSPQRRRNQPVIARPISIWHSPRQAR